MDTKTVRYPDYNHWRKNNDIEENLIAGRCTNCDARFFPWRNICPKCYQKAIEKIDLGLIGTLYTYTIVHAPVKGIKSPYAVGFVDFPERVRLFGQIETDNFSEIDIGMKLEMFVGPIRNDSEQNTVIESFKFRKAV